MQFLQLMWSEINSWNMIAEHTKTLVMFGGINPKNSQVSMGGVTHHETDGWFKEFAKRGIRCTNVSPQRTDSPEQADWVSIKPGTDTAMLLGLAFVLESEALVDTAFIKHNTVGYEIFQAYLTGASDGMAKTPEWAGSDAGSNRIAWWWCRLRIRAIGDLNKK